MADILIPDVADDVIAAIGIKAQRLGISRADYLRRVLARELAVQPVHVSVTDLVDFARAFADTGDPDAMNRFEKSLALVIGPQLRSRSPMHR